MTVTDIATLEASIIEHARHIINDLAGHVIRRRPADLLTEQNVADGWLRWISIYHQDLSGLDEASVTRLYVAFRTAFFSADQVAEEITRRMRRN